MIFQFAREIAMGIYPYKAMEENLGILSAIDGILFELLDLAYNIYILYNTCIIIMHIYVHMHIYIHMIL